jgi:large conductance mechanosensitive channel
MPRKYNKQKQKKSFIDEFVDFLKTFGIIGLAIAFVIGAASSKLVTSVVNDVVNPLVGFFLPSGSLKQLSLNITSPTGNVSSFMYGDLIANVIDFLIIAFIVFLAYRFLSRHKLVEDKTAPPKK